MKKFWNLFNNKKTIIAAFYWGTLAVIIKIWFPDGLPPMAENAYLTIGELLTFLGIGHKVFKATISDKKETD